MARATMVRTATTATLWSDAQVANAWAPFQPTNENPFDGPKVAHLLRRATFGGTTKQIVDFEKQGLNATLNTLFSPKGVKHFDAEADAMIRTSLVLGNTDSLVDWWLYRMLADPHAVREKATFFWHSHFCTGREKVPDSQLLLEQNNTLRHHAMGSFAELVKAISRDAAMLIYLDSTENKKNRPNENYARELLELFCLGIGNYTEHDIKELARCFTGWEVRRRRFRISRSDHDFGVKEVLGTSGALDGDEAIDVILQQPATARFVAKRLIAFYVTDDVVPAEVVEGLAEIIRHEDWMIKPVLRRLFRSQFFFSTASVNRKIASPLDWTLGWIRMLETSGNLNQLRSDLEFMGQVPLEPPNVKGWPGGKTWIDPSRMAARVNWSQRLASEMLEPQGGLEAWMAGQEFKSSNDVAIWVQRFLIHGTLTNSRKSILTEQIETQPSLTDQLRMGIRVAGLMPEAHTV